MVDVRPYYGSLKYIDVEDQALLIELFAKHEWEIVKKGTNLVQAVSKSGEATITFDQSRNISFRYGHVDEIILYWIQSECRFRSFTWKIVPPKDLVGYIELVLAGGGYTLFQKILDHKRSF
jgi:hypothetical protein